MLEVMYISTSEISKKSLESIIKTSGDRVVTGYVRFKKVHPMEGYKKACEVARKHFSKITKGRLLENGTYAVVVRFKLIVFIIPLVIGLLFFMLGQVNYKAKEIIQEETNPPELPTVIIAKDYEGMYIDIPGIKALKISRDNPVLELRNPIKNNCTLVYEIIYDEEVIGTSGYIYPGQSQMVELELGEQTEAGEIQIIAKGYSLDKKDEYSSLLQRVQFNFI